MKVEETQSLAWFKLAEFVGRGEKERALSLFRLLTHSLSDKAFIKKLQAEILASFDDIQASYEYIQSAYLYSHDGQTIEAVSIYQHLFLENPESVEYIEKIISLFKELDNQKKVIVYQKKLCSLFLQKKQVGKAVVVFEVMQNSLDDLQKLMFEKDIVLCAVKTQFPNRDIVDSYLKKALDRFMRFSQEFELQSFLSSLEALNKLWHKDALTYLNQL